MDKSASIAFKQSAGDKYRFYHNDIIFIVYSDNGVYLRLSNKSTYANHTRDWETGLDVEGQGQPSVYIGVNVRKQANGVYKFSQLDLIDEII